FTTCVTVDILVCLIMEFPNVCISNTNLQNTVFKWIPGKCRACKERDIGKCCVSVDLSINWEYDDVPSILALLQARTGSFGGLHSIILCLVPACALKGHISGTLLWRVATGVPRALAKRPQFPL